MDTLADRLQVILLLEGVYALLSPRPEHALATAVFAFALIAWAGVARYLLT